ncbi:MULTISPECIES: DUF11 domain-containing protein [unclassified Rathayibacter]|uniref:DUF7927 domain-containing protein n=1 Tax=unclassified Rathayibacter TaxID=2609250 RepID=UPI00188AECE3|nr:MULTISPECIES: DUF11 domain-containing protein [unclassified Rathayibacter]MBF4463210.1 DUF11 domain-containing protein [Rathayibacter sp. VKM Ac-2879]MBF4504553.1 DUF11 domain-containing protein [Rathayibacter sp. VKM Ac-2878]
MSGTQRSGARRRAHALLGCGLVGGVLAGGMAAVPVAAAQEPVHTTIENTLLHGGTTNGGVTTISAYVRAGETLNVDLHPLRAGTGLGEGESGGGTAAITGPDGAVLDSQVFPRGAPPSVTAGGAFIARETGVHRITVTDDDVMAPVNLVWDVGVADARGAALSGRVWSTSYGIQSGARESYASSEERQSSFTLHAITETGARYDLALRDYDGVASTLQATNKGNVRVGSSDPSYLSAPMPSSSESGGVGATFLQPSGRSDIEGLQTYKLFLDPPAADLPPTIAPEYRAPTIEGVAYRRAATGSDAGTLTGTLGTQPGTVLVDVDVEGDGSYDGARDVHLSTIVAEAGPFSVDWDGRDASGQAVDIAEGSVAFRATLGRTNEFHVTRVDAEVSAGGIALTDALAGGTATAIHWDDSLFADSSAERYSGTPEAASGADGADSAAGVHGWEGDDSGQGRSPNTNDSVHGSYGDLRAIDDWIFGSDEAVAFARLDALTPHVTLAKTSSVDSDTPLLPGTRVPYRITLTSDGSGDDTDVSVVDYLDEGVLDDADLDAESIRTTHGSASVEPSTGRVRWQAGTLPVGTVAALTFDVLVHGKGDRALVNTACLAEAPFVPAASTAGTDSNPCATVPHTIGEGRLWLKKTASQSSAVHGGTAGFDIVVGNSGTVDAEDVVVTDIPSLEHLSDAVIDDGAGGVQPADKPVTRLRIAAGEQLALHVSGRVAEGYDALTIPNRALISDQPDGFDPPTIENACVDDASSSCAEIPVPPIEGRLSIEKTALSASIAHGGTAGFSIVVANIGERPAEGVTLTDLPALEHLSGVTISRDGGPASGDLSVEALALEPGESTTFTVTGKVADGVDAWAIPNRARLDHQPDGFSPPVVAHACADDATASCAVVEVPPVGVVATVLASTGAVVGPLALGAGLLLLAGGGFLARRRLRSPASAD